MLLEEVTERMWSATWLLSWTQGNQRLRSLCPDLQMYVLPMLPTVGPISRTQPWESKVLLRPSGLICEWTKLRPLWKLEILVGGAEIYPLAASLVSFLVHWACHLSFWSGLPLFSVLLACRVQGPVCKRTCVHQEQLDEWQLCYSHTIKYHSAVTMKWQDTQHHGWISNWSPVYVKLKNRLNELQSSALQNKMAKLWGNTSDHLSIRRWSPLESKGLGIREYPGSVWRTYKIPLLDIGGDSTVFILYKCVKLYQTVLCVFLLWY